MKLKKRNKTMLQFPLPTHMFERAKKELTQADLQIVATVLENENVSTHTFVTRRINGLLYCDFISVKGFGNQKKIV